MRLHINWTACDGRGGCLELLPEVLDRDPWGYPIPRGSERDPTIAPELMPYAQRAVATCPRLALALVTPAS